MVSIIPDNTSSVSETIPANPPACPMPQSPKLWDIEFRIIDARVDLLRLAGEGRVKAIDCVTSLSAEIPGYAILAARAAGPAG